MEAIICSPLLLASVGMTATHAGQTTLYLTTVYDKTSILKPLIANICVALPHEKDTAKQFRSVDCWVVLLRNVSDKLAPSLGTFRPTSVFSATG